MRTNLPPLDTPGLTTREIEVLRLAATLRAGDIAAMLGISTSTVKVHLQNVRMKYRDGQDRIRLKAGRKR